MSDPNNTGIFPKKMWIELWDRAAYSISVEEIELELARMEGKPECFRRGEKRLRETLEEHKAALNEARQALKPYMRRKMIRGGLDAAQ